MGMLDWIKEKSHSARDSLSSARSATADFAGNVWNNRKAENKKIRDSVSSTLKESGARIKDVAARGWEGTKGLAQGAPEAARALYKPENIVAPAKGILRGTKAFAGTRFGKVVMVSGAAIAAAVGINAGLNKSNREDADFAKQQALESAALQQELQEKKARMMAMSGELGQNNPRGNFRASVRGTGGPAQQDI